MTILPHVVYSRDPELRWDRKTLEWVVLREFWVYWYRAGKPMVSFSVLKDFRTDLASIPRLFRSVVPQVGPNLQAAIVHDWCLTRRMFFSGVEMTERLKHRLFLDGMASLSVPYIRRKVMYRAVRTWGWWKRLTR